MGRITIIFFVAGLSLAGIFGDPLFLPMVSEIISLRFDHEYRIAEDKIRKLKKEYPSDPGVYFLLASNLHDDMLNRENYSRIETMNALFDTAIALAKSDTTDPWNIWIIGSSLGYRAIAFAEMGRYFSAIRTAGDAMGYLEKARKHKATYADAALGTGGYRYWKSAKLGILTALPFFADERQEGIDELRLARGNSIYSSEAAIHALVYIFCEEGMVDSARAMRDIIHTNHPKSLLPLWYDLAIAEKDGDLKKYFMTANELSARLDSIGEEQSANRIEVHRLAAESAKRLGDWEMVCYHCSAVLNSRFSSEIESERKKTINAMAELAKEARKKGYSCD